MESRSRGRVASWWPRVALGIAMAFVALFSAHAAEPEIMIPSVVEIPAGGFVLGSDRAEREAAYRLDEAAYGHSRTREWGWYEDEAARATAELPGFALTRTPITNGQYAVFIAATGRPAPDVEPAVWASYGLIHPFERTRRHAWRDGTYPKGRADHPVVLVSHADAEAYAAWLSTVTGASWRLPSEAEWEKAVRGADGRRFPWGDIFDPARLNSHDSGPFDTLPVGIFPAGAGPWGVLDGAGQVYEWTDTPAGPDRYIVKGGSWDDSGCGVCRPAARHARPAEIKHILIGIRLLRETD